MVNVKFVNETVAQLGALSFYPADAHARTAIVGIVCSMATTEEQVRWLVRRMLILYNTWPGTKELRALFCSKFRPRDGINAYSEIFPEGIPSEKSIPLAIEGAIPKRLAAGEPMTTDADLDIVLQKLTAAKAMPRARPVNDRFAQALTEALTAPKDRKEVPGPTPKVITQEDVDRAVQERHAALAGKVSE